MNLKPIISKKEKEKEEDSRSKILRNLTRQELLQLLLEQMQEAETQKAELDSLKETYERLKEKLQNKDQEIEATKSLMKEKLDAKDLEIEATKSLMKEKLDAKDSEMEQFKARMIDKLNFKDAHIQATEDHLKHRLDQKDEKIRELNTALEELKASRRVGYQDLPEIRDAIETLSRYFTEHKTETECPTAGQEE